MAELTETPLDSTSVLKDSLLNLSEAIREADAIVTYEALPEVYMGAAHLEQVFQNLIGNALKYRSDERPRIQVSAVRRGAQWCFSVEDNGIGIDPQYKEKIFGVFKQLHHERTYSGTGIGLAICQRVIERYGGRIRVESEPGKGAIFYFTVPGDAVQPARRVWNLLLAEDNFPDVVLVREVLRIEELPLRIHVVTDGEQAIDFIARAESDSDAPCPHLVLLDLNLPRKDGFEVLRRLRQSGKCGNIPVVVITSSDAPTDRKRAAELGAHYFRKPPSYNGFLKLGADLKRLMLDHHMIGG